MRFGKTLRNAAATAATGIAALTGAQVANYLLNDGDSTPEWTFGAEVRLPLGG